MILKLKPTDVKRFNAYRDKFESQWLKVISCENVRSKLSNQWLELLQLCSA